LGEQLLKIQDDVKNPANEQKFSGNAFNLKATPADRTSEAKTSDAFKMDLRQLMNWILRHASLWQRTWSWSVLPSLCS